MKWGKYFVGCNHEDESKRGKLHWGIANKIAMNSRIYYLIGFSLIYKVSGIWNLQHQHFFSETGSRWKIIISRRTWRILYRGKLSYIPDMKVILLLKVIRADLWLLLLLSLLLWLFSYDVRIKWVRRKNYTRVYIIEE